MAHVWKIGDMVVGKLTYNRDVTGWGSPTNPLWSVHLEDSYDWESVPWGCADHGVGDRERKAAHCSYYSPYYAVLPWEVRE